MSQYTEFETNETITKGRRIASLLTDWMVLIFCVMLVLAVLLFVDTLLHWFTPWRLSPLAWCISLLLFLLVPLWLGGTYLEVKRGGSMGQQMMRLQVAYQQSNLGRRLLRSGLKVMPVASFLYALALYFISGEMSGLAWGLLLFSALLLILILVMTFTRADRRHFIDLLVGSYLISMD
ncbi:hypothetical protein CL176_03135 [Suicoccus acidiformans]|uniref:RDD domain-containing protein n=1 Tax=Suicoccus acidiformans TaxID=2036206 RepID=A0A347WJ45_9LACT|nr:RDD family protein [Suicoccus acidiformans]AXY25102.1 hypothetical protein CL176_03135 [Suicoccus acidiformans]